MCRDLISLPLPASASWTQPAESGGLVEWLLVGPGVGPVMLDVGKKHGTKQPELEGTRRHHQAQLLAPQMMMRCWCSSSNARTVAGLCLAPSCSAGPTGHRGRSIPQTSGIIPGATSNLSLGGRPAPIAWWHLPCWRCHCQPGCHWGRLFGLQT